MNVGEFLQTVLYKIEMIKNAVCVSGLCDYRVGSTLWLAMGK